MSISKFKIKKGIFVFKTANFNNHEYLIDKKLQDNEGKIHVDFSKIFRKDVSKFPTLISDFYNTPLAVSGYGETRHFYFENQMYIHTGVDVFLTEGEKILAPSGTEIIAAYWLGQDQEWAEGVGGVICLRLKISELDIPTNLKEYVYIKKKGQSKNESIHFRVPKFSFSENGKYKTIKTSRLKYESKSEYEKYLNTKTDFEKNKIQEESKYIYLRIIHFSKNTISMLSKNTKTFSCKLPGEKDTYNCIVAMDIDYNNPKKVKKGQTIGFIGAPDENGGWATHADINIYSVFSSHIQGKNYKGKWNRYILDKSLKNKEILLNIMNYVNVESIKKIKDNKEPSRKDNILKLKIDGNFDPNEVFSFYNNDIKRIIAS